MLYRPGQAPVASPARDINGRKLSRALKRISPAHRALLAHALESGADYLHHLTRQQSLALTEASAGYVATVAKLTPEEREQLKRGKLSLAVVHNRKREPTDAELDRLVAKIGANRIMAAVDRYTQHIKVPSALQVRAQQLGCFITIDQSYNDPDVDFGPYVLRDVQAGKDIWGTRLPVEGIAEALDCARASVAAR